MKKVLCVATTLLACAGALYVAYEAGKGNGYKAGLRDAEEKHKCGCGEDCEYGCECQCHADEVSGLEAEGEAVAPAPDTSTANSDASEIAE